MNDLEGFKNWWLDCRIIDPPLDNSLVFVADTHGIVLYRQNEYQVELFIVKPNSEIKPHVHPNVDSFEVYLSGDITFMCNGIIGEQHYLGTTTRVTPNSWHGGTIGARGGSFLSIQKWLNGVKPTFVGDDWRDDEGKASYGDSAENKKDEYWQ